MIKVSYLFESLDELMLLNFNCLKLGLRGLPDGYQLPVEYVQEYISNILNKEALDSESVTILVDALLIDTRDDLIQVLSRFDFDDEVDKQNMAAAELNIILKHVDGDFVHDLIDITSFWNTWFSWTKNKLFSYQGVDDNLPPEEYYSKENFQIIYHRSKEWVNNVLKINES